jgi:hypothetical protein
MSNTAGGAILNRFESVVGPDSPVSDQSALIPRLRLVGSKTFVAVQMITMRDAESFGRFTLRRNCSFVLGVTA